MMSQHVTINASHMSQTHAIMAVDDMSEPSSPESSFDDSDILHHHMHDNITSQLAAAGPIGVAAAACIATGKKRKRPHAFETNPSIRKRQQTRLLRKLKHTIEEYTTRVGQQAVVLCCTPGKPAQSPQAFKVIGSQPLENVIRNIRMTVMGSLDEALASQTPAQDTTNSGLHELPPLVIDGIPTPVDKMTQAQLRAFIPEMLKYSEGRGKPHWGRLEYKPIWWPSDLPWANVRSDARSENQKREVSWTHALRTIVKNCYKHHGRDDLLPEFSVEDNSSSNQQYSQTMVQTINNPDGTLSIIQIDTAGSNVVTLPDGSQATVVHAIPATTQEATQAVQTLAEVATNQHAIPFNVELQQDGSKQIISHEGGQIILSGENIGTSGIMSIPVSMYQTVVANLQSASGNQTGQGHHVQVAMIPTTSEQTQIIQIQSSHKVPDEEYAGDSIEVVPDATQAVEVMTIDTSSSSS